MPSPLRSSDSPANETNLRHIVHRVNLALVSILERLDGTPLGDSMTVRVTELAGAAALGRAVDYASALTAYRWVLARAGDGSLPLTAAGYLKPAVIPELAAVMPTMADWPSRSHGR